MDIQLIDFEKEVLKLESPRRPHDMVFVDDSLLRAVLCQGEGKWYVHDYDEFFLHHKGGVVIESDNSTIELKPGTGILVPAGVRHRTNSEDEGVFLVFRHQKTACTLA
ncbi:MAG: cupin domain-containing protein [ANME-2 cluster archaeon]|nr:cupin domain-containing protein [ANME-2 cluster archaeon]MCL7475408.1 cupin domain-containing protein [ANME-2 cluster archaeon]MDF1531112.1 cupin domain-containing protein [ANME-2 cluster archaeon]MDW7775691.1 cupin domain-containing protein [Methanosarcinales archaeon]